MPNRDIFVLANPQIANLPNWVIGLVVAGGLAAALSTAAGLLMVISSAISHDLMKKTLYPNMSEHTELGIARTSAFIAVVVSSFIGAFASSLPFVAQVVAFAFGLAAATIFPALLLGIFSTSMNKEGAIAGMMSGLIFTASYIIYYKFINPAFDNAEYWVMGISPEGIGFIGMLINFSVAVLVSFFYARPPNEVTMLVESIRLP